MGRLDSIRRWWHRMVDCFHNNHDVKYSGPWVREDALRPGQTHHRNEVMVGTCKNCGCRCEMIHDVVSGKTTYVTYDNGQTGSRRWSGASYGKRSTGGDDER